VENSDPRFIALLSGKGFGDDADVRITELSCTVWEHYGTLRAT